MGRRHRQKPGVYLIQDERGPIKIGVTSLTGEYKLRAVQYGNPRPLRLLAIVDGTERHEELLHRMLIKFWIHGEWFEVPTGKPREAILKFFQLDNTYL